MTGYPCTRLPLFAAAGFAIMMAAAAPATAADLTPKVVRAAAPGSEDSAIKSRELRGRQLARAAHDHRVGRGGDCSGDWCGRQFVLMVGVAY